MEIWEQHKSTKQMAVVRLILHHLAADGEPPLEINKEAPPEENKLIPVAGENQEALPEGLGPDKIVVYTAFPSQNVVLMSVSGATYARAHVADVT